MKVEASWTLKFGVKENGLWFRELEALSEKGRVEKVQIRLVEIAEAFGCDGDGSPVGGGGIVPFVGALDE